MNRTSEKFSTPSQLRHPPTHGYFSLMFARSLIYVTFLWAFIILVLGSILYSDDNKLWDQHIVPATICLSLTGVGLVGVAKEASELLASGIAGVAFAAIYIHSILISQVVKAVEKGATTQNCITQNFYQINKTYCDAITAIDLTTIGILSIMYLIGTCCTVVLWKTTFDMEEKNKTQSTKVAPFSKI